MATTLAELKTELEAKQAAALAEITPLQQKVDALRAKIQPLEAELRVAQKALSDAETRTRSRALAIDIAKLQRVLRPPTRRLTNDGPAPPAKPPAA